MNIHSFDKKLHNGRLFGTLRRVVAGALTAAMLLPMVPTFGVNNEIKLQPIQDEKYRPDIEIQSNFVRDDFGFLTGYMELGLRVKTGGEPFRYLAVSLEYDTELYTPVDWSATADEIKIRNMPTDTPKLPYDYYSEELPAQKEEHINFVRAYTGIPDTPAADLPNAALTPEVKSGRHALVSFWASATDRLTDDENDSVDGVAFKEMTTIAVIRFKVNEDELENFTIKKNSDGTGYDIFYKDEKVTNVVELQTEMNKPAANKWGKSVEFADDADIYVTEPDTELALEYRAGSVRLDATGNPDKVNGTLYERRYYYLPGYDAAQNVKVNLVREGKTYANVDKPNYLNLLDPAVKVPSKVGDADRFSYLTNLIVDKTGSADPKDDHYYVTFPVVSERSFMAGEDILDKLTTIVYVDWDNTLLGTQIVPQNTDVRGLVSDYVAENFIYHDTIDTAYGDNDLNNPLALTAANPNDLTPAEAVVKSLERKYNYRGKYPADGPAADGTTNSYTVDDKTATNSDGDRILPLGVEYPLTNKLDYVFFKRPMGHDAATEPDPTTYPNGATDPQYLADKATWENTWVQPSSYNAASNAYTIEYDVERPFAYGWAKCTQANFEDVWTTMGTTGELNSYTVDGNGVATVVYDGDYDFEFADLKTGFKTGEKTVFLKAVYEPGTELLDTSFFYRIIQEPYYSKLNAGAAQAGGAYSASTIFERATTSLVPGDTTNLVRGVTRLREPTVRQDTTTDLRWEADTTLGVNHDLTNADLVSTYDDKDKSTFTLVSVTNTDEIEFSLTLSARQNKVDYYLTDSYGLNFVSGTTRSDNDKNRSEVMAIMDNYNYYVQGESNETDLWYDAPYNDREGSRGFVLYGTLNQIMEEATRTYNGARTTNAFVSTYLSTDVIRDMNLRLADGTFPTGLSSRQAFGQKIVDAAGAAQAAHLGGNNTYWDTEHNCAQLTYHQLQGYILNASLNHPETPVSGLNWCHLHKACADANSSKPQNWGALLTAAATPGTLNPSDFILSELEGIAHLRKADGSKYATPAEYISALETVVATVAGGASASWDAVQAQIMGNGDTAADGPNKYWWYDGADSVSLTNWGELLTAAKDAYDAEANLAPGETAATAVLRPAKLNQLETAFNANAAATSPDADWVAGTDNLCADNNGTKFASFTDFKDALTDALSAADTAGVTNPTWHQVQYHIIHKDDAGYTFPNPLSTAQDTETKGYWFYKGGEKVVDLPTLLKAADQANNGNTAALDAVDMAVITDTVHLRKDVKGTKYADTDPQMTADLTAIKTTLKTLVQASGTSLTWEQVQYYIARGTLADKTTVVDPEAAYYWWKDGGEGTVITFTATSENTTSTTNSNINKLIEAVFRYKNYGDLKAMASFTSATDIFTYTRLIESVTNDPPGALTDLAEFTSVEDFADKVLQAINAGRAADGITDTFFYPSLTWYQIQDFWLEGSGTLRTDAVVKANTDYWWYNKAANTANNPASPLVTAIEGYIAGTLTPAQLQATSVISVPLLNTTYKIKKTTAGANWMPMPPAANLNAAKASLLQLANDVQTSAYYNSATGKVNLSWAQIQYYFAGNARTLVSTADAMTAIQGWGWTEEGSGGAKPYIPQGVATFSLRPAMLMMMRPAEPQVETTLSEDGLTETTKTTTRAWDQVTGYEVVTIVTQVVTRVPNGETTTVITTTTTVTTTIDETTGEPVTTSDTQTTVTEELATPETPLAPLPDDPYTITPDTDVIETEEPTEPPAESTVTPEETPEPGAGDKTEPAGDADETTGETTSTPAPSDPVETDVPTGPETDPPEDKTEIGDPGGPTTDPPETTEPSTDPPDLGGGEAETLALARARLRLKPLSLISIRRTKAPPPLISIITPNSSAGRALL